MTPLFPARRRAERFDSWVEGGRRDGVDRDTSDLLELVGALRSVPEAEARPEFVADLRERLMLAAESELTPVKAGPRERDDVARLTIKPVRTRHQRRLSAALGAFAIVGATTSMAVASQGALPGDALYPVKRAIENTQAGFAVGDDAKGETIMGNASERLDEVDQLSKKDKPDAQLVTKTLDTFTQQFTDANNALLADYEDHGNPASIQQIHHNASESMGTLQALDAVIPPAAHAALAGAAAHVFGVDQNALNVCPDPDCGEGLLELPATLLAGATQSLSDTVNDTLAGGELPGTTPPSEEPGASQPQGNDGGKGSHNPSGMNPPETPIDLPTETTDATTGLGGLLPGGGTDTGTGGNGGHDGNGGNGGNGGKGGKGGKVDFTPVTSTVTQVVTGVVEGVNGLLNGLTGGGN